VTVTGVALSGFIYSPPNHDPETDSNGTSISFARR
jgi:hypothetical protein